MLKSEKLKNKMGDLGNSFRNFICSKHANFAKSLSFCLVAIVYILIEKKKILRHIS